MPFHPARSGLVVVSGEPAGALGELHPGVAERFDLPGRVALAEVDVAVFARNGDPDVTYREIPRFPPVLRDLAFVVDLDVPAARVHDAIVEGAAGLVDSVALFDVFMGEPVPSGRKRLAFSVDFRAADRTLTAQEVDAAVEAVARRVADDLGGELRTA